MSKKSTTLKVLLILLCLGLPASIAATWVIRGEFDRFYMMEGRLHVVNATQENHQVTLTFPSGQRLEFEIADGFTADAEILETGEGMVTVEIDGTRVEKVGYVTRRNNIMVITVGEERVVFSQIYP